MNIFGEIPKKKREKITENLKPILENYYFWLFSDKFKNNLFKIIHKFSRKFLRFLKSTRRSSEDILMKFWKNCEKFLERFERNWEENFKWFQKNYGNIIRKDWNNPKLILLILRKNFKSFVEIRVIWVKLKKTTKINLRKTFEKFRKHFAQTLKKVLTGTLWSFHGSFWKN